MKKIAILLPLLLSFGLLQGCHSSSSNNQSTVRLVNDNGAANSLGTVPPLDMYWSATASVSAVAATIDYGTASSSVTSGSGVSTIQLAPSGSSATGGATFSFVGGTSYTMLAYPTYTTGPSGQINSLQVLQLIDNQTVPNSGNALVGIVDRSGAGSLDIYISAGSSSTPSGTWVSGISGTIRYTTLPLTTTTGTTAYHVQVTGAGAGYGNDVRLDIPSVLIGNQQILTLVLTPTTGGALVDGLVFFQQGQSILTGQQTVTSYKNGSVRVRIVDNIGGSISSSLLSAYANVNASSTSIPILSATLNPGSVGSYLVVPLNGGTPASPQSTGVAVASVPLTLTLSPAAPTNGVVVPGTDLTLLAYGTPPYPLLNDDNTLAASGYAKLRLVNGISGGSAVSLTYGGVAVQNAQNVAVGSQSTPTNVLIPGGTPSPIGVTGASLSAPLSPTLLSQGVYTLFMLSNAVGVVNPDHSFQGP